ncbi:DCC1-like thiol-disulfide oxidoreductase family protein [Actinospica robiniae]|uniref:DCC1-like thiol-disulfide oxidoreductase family protein n=1 Tax=Actinospica robiniae TaxID=304901 RepID=UPI0012F8D393|nr:DCC1-like thiol-disulfide oxidoreductase family protein [Actinospica robiniae]
MGDGLVRPGLARLGSWAARRYELITETALALRGAAALRIGYGTLWTLFLLREWGERDAAWGPNAYWSPTMERSFEAQKLMPSILRDWLTAVAGLGGTGFQLFYLLAILAGVLFALGWRTRISSLLFCFVVVALENRSPFITDGGDNVLVLMSLYLCFARCGRHWSLDARRTASALRVEPEPEPAARPAWRDELAAIREQIANVLHNGAVLVIAAQVCVIYATAGLYKVQGSMWQDGTALGFILRLHWFEPWPALSSWLLGHAVLLALAGYLTVFVQVAFPFTVFTAKLKYPSLVVLAGMHLAIAVLLGLPFFSLIMLVGDAVFLSDRVWRAVERAVAGPAYAESMNGSVLVAESVIATAPTPTLVFDGDCAFCSSSVRWAQRWCRPAVRFVPWQEIDLDANGLTYEQVTSAVRWLAPGAPRSGRAPHGAAAVGRLLLRSRWPWRPFGALLLTPPFSWIGAGLYHLIAVNRHRLPGGTPACAVPRKPAASEPHADELG